MQELLLADTSEISLLVFPDINAPTMANILDYIYTGSVLLHCSTLTDFLSVANLLKLRIEPDPVLEPKINIPPDPKEPIKYSEYNYDKYPPGFDPRYKPNYEYKNPVCGPECFESFHGYKNGKEQICDYKTQEKRLKFSPIILQDERHPNLTNGSRLNESKVPLHYLKPKEVTPAYTNLDSINHNITPFQKDYPSNYIPEQNGVHSDPINSSTNKVTSIVQNGAFTHSTALCETEGKSLEVLKKKTLRKVPNLMPISRFTAFKAKKGLYNRVFPSPWSPRVNPVVADPRNEYITREKLPLHPVSSQIFFISTSLKLVSFVLT